MGGMKIGNLDGIIDLRGGLLPAGPWEYARRELSDLGPDGPLRWLGVHHTAAPVAWSTPRAIARYHVISLGWPGIGYHFVVGDDGRIFYVGDILTIRYNVAGQNDKVVGVCLSGDFTQRAPPPKQLEAARDLLANLQYALGWAVPIMGHREIALQGWGTACPGDTFLEGRRWKDALLP